MEFCYYFTMKRVTNLIDKTNRFDFEPWTNNL